MDQNNKKNNKKITIAIDGYSSTGKSTIAKQLAEKLQYIYVDSGAMYRAVTLYAIENEIISEDFFDKEKLIAALDLIDVKFEFNTLKNRAEIYLNNRKVERKIRSLAVSNFVSQIAEIEEVRKKLVAYQKQLGKHKGVVMDGRDLGTVVFPRAEIKLFITASDRTRAQRRFDELVGKGDDVSFNDILKNVTYRDQIDSTREHSPQKRADDAIEIYNSHMTTDEQFNLI